MGEPSLPKDCRPFSGTTGSGRPHVPSRRRRWADITSDEELSFSFMKSRAMANCKSFERSCGKSTSMFMGTGRSRCHQPTIPETSTATDLDGGPVLAVSERKPWRLPHYEECSRGISSPDINGFFKSKNTDGRTNRESSFVLRGNGVKGRLGPKAQPEVGNQDATTFSTSSNTTLSHGTLTPSLVFSRFPKGFSSVMDVILSNTSQKSLNESCTDVSTRVVSDPSVLSIDLHGVSTRTSGIPSLNTPLSENHTASGSEQACQPKVAHEQPPVKDETDSTCVSHKSVSGVMSLAVETTDATDAGSSGRASSVASGIRPYAKFTPLELLSTGYYLALSKNTFVSEPPLSLKQFDSSPQATNDQTRYGVMGSWSQFNTRHEGSSYYASCRRAMPEQHDVGQERWREETSCAIGSSTGLPKRFVPTVKLQQDKPRENESCNNENKYPLFTQKGIQDSIQADTTHDVLVKDEGKLEKSIKDKIVSCSVEVVTPLHPDINGKPELPRSNRLKREKNLALTIPPTTFVSMLNLSKGTDITVEDNEYPEIGNAALTLPVVSPDRVKNSSTRASLVTVVSKGVDSKLQRPVADALSSQQLQKLAQLVDNKSCVPQKSQKRQAKTLSKNKLKGKHLTKPDAATSVPTATSTTAPVQNSVRIYRLRQLAIEKSSPEYLRYAKLVDKMERTAEQPQTPRVDVPMSCGEFYARLHEWRYQVRRWSEEQSCKS